MARQLPQPGRRASVRRVRDDGEVGDVVGFVLTASEHGLAIRNRRGEVQELSWDQVVAWRPVGVARGRDPRSTPRAELDALAVSAGVHGRCFVARLCDLLDRSAPLPVPGFGAPPPEPAVVDGEWVTTGVTDQLLAVAWWAAHHDARSMQVRSSDAADEALLLAAGFSERPS